MKVKYTGDDWFLFGMVCEVVRENENNYIVKVQPKDQQPYAACMSKNDVEIVES